MGQPHKHAELIKAWADGAEIQMRCPDFENWQDMDTPTWHEVLEYRIKPEPPKSYVTQLSFSESMPNVDYSKLKSVSICGIEFVPAAMLEKVASFALEAGRGSVLYRDEKKPNGIPYESVIVEINLQEIIEKAKGGA